MLQHCNKKENSQTHRQHLDITYFGKQHFHDFLKFQNIPHILKKIGISVCVVIFHAEVPLGLRRKHF